jgi:TPR repeat protein
LFVGLLMVGCGADAEQAAVHAEKEEKINSTPAESNQEQGQDQTKSLPEKSDAEAHYKLGYKYHYGKGIPRDYAEAFKWYRLAAEQGHAKAQYALGGFYNIGKGVSKDYKESFKWYSLAAEQGLKKAMVGLASQYRGGRGVPKDLIHAYAWTEVYLTYARIEFDKRAKKLPAHLRGISLPVSNPYEHQLPKEQIAEAQALSTKIYKRIEANKKD